MSNYLENYGYLILPNYMKNNLLQFGEKIISENPLVLSLSEKIERKYIPDITSDVIGNSDKINSYLDHMRGNGIVDRTLVPAMLSTQIQKISREDVQYRKLQGFVYWLSTVFTDSQMVGVVGEAAREVRLLATSPVRAKFWKTFDCDWSGINAVGESLEKFKEEKFRGIFPDRILRLLKVANQEINPKIKINTKSTRKNTVTKRIKIIRSSNLMQDENHEVNQIVVIDAKTRREEAGGDLEDTSKWVFVKMLSPSEIDRDRTIKHKKSMEVASQLTMREVSPPSRYSSLTNQELKALVKAIDSGLKRNELAWAVIAVMLFFGRGMNESIQLFKNRNSVGAGNVFWRTDSLTSLKYTMELPNDRPSQYADLDMVYFGVSLHLPLPEILNTIAYDKKHIAENEESYSSTAIEECINKLNDTLNVRFTKTGISNVVYEMMRGMGFSESDIIWITGGTPKQFASLYYYTVPEEKLRETHKKYLAILTELTEIDLSPVVIENSRLFLGSKVSVSFEKVRSISHAVLSEKSILSSRSFESLIAFHNQFVWKCYFIFSLFSAHRAVNNPFQNINDFNLYSETVWISDKENRNGESSRTIPIPKILVFQINFMIRHYKRLVNWLLPVNKELSGQMGKILHGDRDSYFLSLIYIDKIDGINVKKIKDHFSAYYLLPPNWQRHFLRNYLDGERCSQDQISAFLGHANFGRESHGRWSAFSSSDVDGVRYCLNALAERLEISAVEGL